MEELLELARKVSDKAEVFSVEGDGHGVSFENGRLKDIESRMQSGLSLRIMKEGVLGFAYTRNLVDREGLIRNALDSLKGGVEANFDLPLTSNVASLHTYEPEIETLSSETLVKECSEVCDCLCKTANGQLNISASRSAGVIRLMNSSGTNLSHKSSAYRISVQILYPYTSASLHRGLIIKKFERTPQPFMTFLAETYRRSVKEVKADEGKMQVLFMPETMYVLIWRIQSALNAVNLYQNISPLKERMGETVFDPKFSLFNDPLNDSLPGARSFDDEGMPCGYFPVVEKGVLKNFFYDLYFAEKLKAIPTGHGFRGGISSKPLPALGHLSISPGNMSFQDLVRSMERGIIVGGALGAHSGNIPNGDFSIGVSPAIYVEKGEIVGNVKDVMLAGNIYDVLTNISAIEDTVHPSTGGTFPAVLFPGLKVTVKK